MISDMEISKKITGVINEKIYYLIIGVISMLAMIVPPLMDGALNGSLALAFPNTFDGWVVYLIMQIGASACNIGIFILFKLQARKNVRNEKRYIQAMELMNLANRKIKQWIPRSPKQMDKQDYITKSIFILLSTIGSSICLTSLVINFDWITFLSCMVAIIATVALSWVNMLRNEDYWCNEFYEYAVMFAEKAEIKNVEKVEQTEKEDEVIKNVF